MYVRKSIGIPVHDYRNSPLVPEVPPDSAGNVASKSVPYSTDPNHWSNQPDIAHPTAEDVAEINTPVEAPDGQRIGFICVSIIGEDFT